MNWFQRPDLYIVKEGDQLSVRADAEGDQGPVDERIQDAIIRVNARGVEVRVLRMTGDWQVLPNASPEIAILQPPRPVESDRDPLTAGDDEEDVPPADEL